MGNLLEKAISIFRKPKIVHQTLDPNSVSENATIKNLAIENAELKGQIMRTEAEKAQERESKSDESEENEARLVLDQRDKEIKAKSQIRFFSLGNFFKEYLNNPKFRDNLKVLTFDRKNVLSKFQDFGFSTDGEFVLLGENNKIILKAKTLQDIFQSVPAIENDMMSGLMPVNLDSEWGYVENLQVSEVAEIVPTGDGKFYYSKAKKRPLYQYVQELNDRISELASENEELEETNVKLQDKNDELERANRVIKKGYDQKQVTLSQNEIGFTNMNKIFSDTTKELQQQRFYNANLEEWKETLEEVTSELRGKAEREGTKLSDEKAIEKLNNVVNQIQNMMIPLALNNNGNKAESAQPQQLPSEGQEE